MPAKKLIPFENLPAKEKVKLRKAHKAGKLEVHCPWWPKNHWEEKNHGELFEECFYRIKE